MIDEVKPFVRELRTQTQTVGVFSTKGRSSTYCMGRVASVQGNRRCNVTIDAGKMFCAEHEPKSKTPSIDAQTCPHGHVNKGNCGTCRTGAKNEQT